jgi:Lantibiotic biosynthesis dehydratase C-term
MGWNSVHVYYYGDQDPLIVDAVRPLFGAIKGDAPRCYFVRHWKRGPHLRLKFDAPPDSFAGSILPSVHEVIGGYLKAHPSATRPDLERLVPLHQRLAELEREDGPLTPWHPDNTVRCDDEDSRLSVLGSVDAAELIADFYVQTTDLAFEMTDLVRRREASRKGASFDLMIATVNAFCPGGITKGFVSFRSHAEAFLDGYQEGDGHRAAWDRHYAEQSRTLKQRVSDVVRAVDEEQDLLPMTRDWINALTPIRDRAADLIATGRMSLEQQSFGGVVDGAGSAERRSGRLAGLSPFNRALHLNEQWSRQILQSEWFSVYRVVINCTYLHLARIGLNPSERFFLCHLAANAVEELYGVSARQMVGA